jgi:hypothetical protein
MRARLTLEQCEVRLVLSAGLPADTIAVVSGSVPTSGAVSDSTIPVSAKNIGGRHSVLIGESVQPTNGSTLAPVIVSARGPNGNTLQINRGAPYVAGRHNAALAYVRTGTPGPLTTGITGQAGTAGPYVLRATLPGDINGTGQVTLADEQAFTKSYFTTVHDALYNPAADANQNGQIGQGDGRFLLRNLKPLTPKVPLTIFLTLAPGEEAKGPTPQNSGGTTYLKDVTILGQTTPGSIVFTDDNSSDFSFEGPALPTNAQGDFAINVQLKNGINNFEFMAVDPYGQHTIQVYPIRWLGFR